MKGMSIMFLVMILGLAVAFSWDSMPIIKETVHKILDPTFGYLMELNLNLGFIIIVTLFTFVTILLQKYLTDQNTLKIIKDEQKIIQQEMKLYKDKPEKQMDLSRKSMELQMKAMPLTMKPVLYTTVPFVLTFRWFQDYFITITEKLLLVFNPTKNFLLPQWVWAYLIISILASSILKKLLKVH